MIQKNSRAFRVYNEITLDVEETINVKFIKEDHRDILVEE